MTQNNSLPKSEAAPQHSGDSPYECPVCRAAILDKVAWLLAKSEAAPRICTDPNCKTCAEGRRIDADHQANYPAEPVESSPLPDNRCEGCGEPVYLTRGFGYSHCDTTLNVSCDARPKPTHQSVPKIPLVGGKFRERVIPLQLGLEMFQALQAMVRSADAEHKGLRIADEAINHFTEFTRPAAPPVTMAEVQIHEAENFGGESDLDRTLRSGYRTSITITAADTAEGERVVNSWEDEDVRQFAKNWVARAEARQRLADQAIARLRGPR
jgi:hypothetical protein